MRLEHLLSTFTGRERFPADLVLFNLADTKRRNSHLGSLAVDRDIATFDEAVAALVDVARGDRAARVGGDEWLFLGANGRGLAAAALAAYACTEPYRAGWRCRATKDGDEQEIVEVVTTSITRTARVALAVASSRDDLEPLAARLADGIWQAPVGAPARLDDLAPPTSARWQCVAHYPTRAYYCPFCNSADLAWTDGDGAVYSCDGTCNTCHAALSLTDASPVLRRTGR